MENPKVIAGLAIGAALVVGLGYYLMQPVPLEEEKKQQPKRAASPIKPQERRVPEKPVAKVEEIVEAPKQKLSLEEYLIYLSSLNAILIQNLRKLRKDFHVSRRAKADDPAEYQKLVRKYKVNERQIWESAIDEMLTKESLDKAVFDAAHDEFLNRHEVAAEKEALKRALSFGEVPKDLDLEVLKEIMQTEIKLLAEAQSADDEVVNLETISKIEDKIYEQYGLEIEEVRAASEMHKEQVKKLTREIIRAYNRFRF